MKLSEVKVALLGQPNSGKSTVFNQLTGARQHVGNWPGKTVEKKDGSLGKPAILILNMMDVAEKKSGQCIRDRGRCEAPFIR